MQDDQEIHETVCEEEEQLYENEFYEETLYEPEEYQVAEKADSDSEYENNAIQFKQNEAPTDKQPQVSVDVTSITKQKQDATLTPQDFEKLLVQNPDSSYVWLQYANYYVQLSEVQQALNICQRALQKIPIGVTAKLQDRVNVFLAQFQILNQFYGSQRVVDEYNALILRGVECAAEITQRLALVITDKQCMNQMWGILFKNKTRKNNIETQKHYITYLFNSQQQDVIKKLNLLQIMENCKVFTQNGQKMFLEFIARQHYKFGNQEEGRKIFINLLGNQKLDVILQFIEQEEKYAKVEQTRATFIQLSQFDFKANVQILAMVLKRFYQFEQKHGTSSDQLFVKQLAQKLGK